MTLSLALNNALTGLKVAQKSLSVLSSNVANANTPGYTRKVVDQSALVVDSIGQGARIDGVSRKIDIYLQRAIQLQTSDVGQIDAVNEYLERLQIIFGQPGNANSLDKYVNNFFDSVQALGETPERTSFRADVVNSGAILAQEIYSLAFSLEDLRFQADNDIDEAVKLVNDQIEHLHGVNLAIARAYSLGDDTADLLDDRDKTLKQLAENLNIKVFYREDGQANVYTSDGVSLLDESIYRLDFRPAANIDAFINNANSSAITVIKIDENGQPTNDVKTIATIGVKGSVTTILTAGKIKGLLDVRDKEIPDILDQLDNLAANLRDAFNALHNDGSGFPGAQSLTGTREISGSDSSDWTGEVRIAVLDATGAPIAARYGDEDSAYRPLTLDLSFLNSGFANGQPTHQTIIDEINNYFGPSQPKAKVGIMNNIQLSSLSAQIPGIPPQFQFDFDLENISGLPANFFVTGVTVFDDTAANITSTTQTIPTVALSGVNTYTTTNLSSTVTVNTATPHGLADGDVVFLSTPAAPPLINGIPAGALGGYFTVSNVTSNGFDIGAFAQATATGPVNAAGVTANPTYATVEPGDKMRTRDLGSITADLALNPTSQYYDIDIAVGVDDGSGANNIATSVIRYRVFNNQSNFLNDRMAAQAVTGNGQLVLPTNPQSVMRAILVDADGNELPKINGSYQNGQGYLKLVTSDPTHVISIDELDSKQLGLSGATPPVPGTNRGFSFYYELNNFFSSNVPTNTGDTISGSAIKMAIEQRLLDNPNLVTTGQLTRTNQTADPNDDPQWSYERHIGDNSTIQRLAGLAASSILFQAAGGLPTSTQTFNTYAGELLGYAASNATQTKKSLTDSQILLDGFTQRSDGISGVNLDEELANTIIYQNAYSASARVVTVTRDLFDALINMV